MPHLQKGRPEAAPGNRSVSDRAWPWSETVQEPHDQQDNDDETENATKTAAAV
jgi:hypothetical protein